jgi:hypothetical protein
MPLGIGQSRHLYTEMDKMSLRQQVFRDLQFANLDNCRGGSHSKCNPAGRADNLL